MTRYATPACLATLLCLFTSCAGAPSDPGALPPTQALGDPVPLPDDPARQFDFWLGTWYVVNHRDRDGAWRADGAAVARVQSVVGGGAVLEQWDGSLGGQPLIGFSLRAWDPTLDRWDVWLNWTGSGGPGGFSEMHGRRNGERMELFPPSDDQHLRYSFAEARTQSCQWEQGKSTDGQHWTTDWVMHFSRHAEPLPLDAANAPVVAPPDTAEFPQTRALDFLVGAWEGSGFAVKPDGGRREGVVRARVGSMIQGYGLLQFLDTDWGETNMAALGWDRGADGWVALAAHNRAPGIVRMVGTLQTRSVRFSAPGGRLRETWSCPEDDACTWRRESSADGGTTWAIAAEAQLERSAGTVARVEIPNARVPFEGVLTGGQPSAEQLAWAARNGYRTVVNLRAPGEQGELPDEAARVEALGLRYVAIPMSGAESLSADNAALLAEALAGSEALPALVHCASGNRVGALFGLKAHLIDGASAQEALAIGKTAGATRMAETLGQRLGLLK